MTVHPETLERLTNALPALRTLANLFGAPSKDEQVTEAVDELRENFPGIDDLTLAAFLAYGTRLYSSEDGVDMMALVISFAQMALVLAKPLLGDSDEAA